MTTGILVREYANVVIFLIALIYVTVKLLRCKRLFTHLNFESEKVKRGINIVLIPLIYAGILFELYEYYPLVLDLPYVLNKSYCAEKAISRGYDHADPEFYEKRYVDMEINGKIEEMTLYSYEINENEEYRLIYLPNSKLGQVVPDIK